MMCKHPSQARDTRSMLSMLLGLLLFALSTAPASAEEPIEKAWAVQIGGEESEGSIDLAVDKLGNTYILGTTKSKLTPEVQRKTILNDYFLTKIDPKGKVLWTRQEYGQGIDCSAITVDLDGNVFVAGNTSENMHGQQKIDRTGTDAFVFMYDKDGKRVWTRLFGGFMDDAATDLACDRVGNVHVTGRTQHMVQQSKGSSDCFLVKIDRSGKIFWKAQFGTDQEDASFAIALDPLGNCHVAGITKGDMFGKNAGPNESAKKGSFESYVAKFDLRGQLIWGKQFKAEAERQARAIGLDKTGNIYVSGEGLVPVVFGGRESLRLNSTLTKLNATGQVQWTKGYGGWGNGMSTDLAIDQNSNVFLAGIFTGEAGAGQPPKNRIDGPVVFKIDPAGKQLWMRVLDHKIFLRGRGFFVQTQPRQIAIDKENDLIVAGATRENIGGPNKGEYDVCVIKYKSQ